MYLLLLIVILTCVFWLCAFLCCMWLGMLYVCYGAVCVFKEQETHTGNRFAYQCELLQQCMVLACGVYMRCVHKAHTGATQHV